MWPFPSQNEQPPPNFTASGGNQLLQQQTNQHQQQYLHPFQQLQNPPAFIPQTQFGMAFPASASANANNSGAPWMDQPSQQPLGMMTFPPSVPSQQWPPSTYQQPQLQTPPAIGGAAVPSPQLLQQFASGAPSSASSTPLPAPSPFMFFGGGGGNGAVAMPSDPSGNFSGGTSGAPTLSHSMSFDNSTNAGGFQLQHQNLEQHLMLSSMVSPLALPSSTATSMPTGMEMAGGEAAWRNPLFSSFSSSFDSGIPFSNDVKNGIGWQQLQPQQQLWNQSLSSSASTPPIPPPQSSTSTSIFPEGNNGNFNSFWGNFHGNQQQNYNQSGSDVKAALEESLLLQKQWKQQQPLASPSVSSLMNATNNGNGYSPFLPQAHSTPLQPHSSSSTSAPFFFGDDFSSTGPSGLQNLQTQQQQQQYNGNDGNSESAKGILPLLLAGRRKRGRPSKKAEATTASSPTASVVVADNPGTGEEQPVAKKRKNRKTEEPSSASDSIVTGNRVETGDFPANSQAIIDASKEMGRALKEPPTHSREHLFPPPEALKRTATKSDSAKEANASLFVPGISEALLGSWTDCLSDIIQQQKKAPSSVATSGDEDENSTPPQQQQFSANEWPSIANVLDTPGRRRTRKLARRHFQKHPASSIQKQEQPQKTPLKTLQQQQDQNPPLETVSLGQQQLTPPSSASSLFAGNFSGGGGQPEPIFASPPFLLLHPFNGGGIVVSPTLRTPTLSVVTGSGGGRRILFQHNHSDSGLPQTPLQGSRESRASSACSHLSTSTMGSIRPPDIDSNTGVIRFTGNELPVSSQAQPLQSIVQQKLKSTEGEISTKNGATIDDSGLGNDETLATPSTSSLRHPPNSSMLFQSPSSSLFFYNNALESSLSGVFDASLFDFSSPLFASGGIGGLGMMDDGNDWFGVPYLNTGSLLMPPSLTTSPVKAASLPAQPPASEQTIDLGAQENNEKAKDRKSPKLATKNTIGKMKNSKKKKAKKVKRQNSSGEDDVSSEGSTRAASKPGKKKKWRKKNRVENEKPLTETVLRFERRLQALAEDPVEGQPTEWSLRRTSAFEELRIVLNEGTPCATHSHLKLLEELPSFSSSSLTGGSKLLGAAEPSEDQLTLTREAHRFLARQSETYVSNPAELRPRRGILPMASAPLKRIRWSLLATPSIRQ